MFHATVEVNSLVFGNILAQMLLGVYLTSKNALARSCKKRSFFLAPCRNLAGFLQEICARILQDSCKIPQDPAKSRRMYIYIYIYIVYIYIYTLYIYIYIYIYIRC